MALFHKPRSTLAAFVLPHAVATFLAAASTSQQPAACGAATREMSPAEQTALEFQQSAVRGRAHLLGVHRVLKDLTWHSKLDDAAKVARAQGKLIVWVQALGDIRGVT